MIASSILNDLGSISLIGALCCCVWGFVSAWLGKDRNNRNLLDSAYRCAWMTLGLVLVGSGFLWRALLSSDFSNAFAQQHSSTDLPLLYKMTAFWGGMEGSLLLWELMLIIFTCFALHRSYKHHLSLLPDVMRVLFGIQIFLLGLLVSWSNPFALQLPALIEGRGLNPLLQHPAMAFHPPLLYVGYVSSTIPFGYAIAAMLQHPVRASWLAPARFWTLISWYALGVGQMLGGYWAYQELGWGGYWGWDPVENAALLPWLASSALLHTMMMEEKRGTMRVWNFTLVIATFGLSMLGTFIVRSGVLNSVHSFAESSIGPAFLIFLAVIMVGAFGLLIWRLPYLTSRKGSEHLFSRESALLLNNVLLLGIAGTVLLGTLFPLLAEALQGVKLSIQAPFFNTVIAPPAIALLFLIGIGTLLTWQRASLPKLIQHACWPALGAVLSMAFGSVWHHTYHVGTLLIFCGAGFTGVVVVQDLLRSAQATARQQQQSLLKGAWQSMIRGRQRWGSAFAHLGIICLFIGFSGSFFKTEQQRMLMQGAEMSIGDYRLRYQGMQIEKVANVTLRKALLEVYHGDQFVTILTPAQSFYPTQPEPLNEVAIHRTLKNDLYLILTAENSNSVTIRAMIIPLVAFLSGAIPLFTLGVSLSLWRKTVARPELLAELKQGDTQPASEQSSTGWAKAATKATIDGIDKVDKPPAESST